MKKDKLLMVISPRGFQNEIYLDRYTKDECDKYDTANSWAYPITVSELNRKYRRALHEACDYIYDYGCRETWYTYDDIVKMIDTDYGVILGTDE